MRIELCRRLRDPRVLAEALGARMHGACGELRGISTDSREVREGDIFAVLSGAHTHGKAYISQALANGAVGVLTQEDVCAERGFVWTVPSVTSAFLRAAEVQRTRSRAKAVAVSGSTGKTTVKEGIAAILAQMGRVEKTEGNFNSTLGLPLSVLSFEDADFWVCELGISHSGEMLPMARTICPDLAVLTGVGHAHIGNFADWNALFSEKAQIAACMRTGGRLLLPQDLPQSGLSCGERVLFGIGRDFRMERISHTPKGVQGDLIAPDRVITNLRWPIPGSVGVATVTTVAAAGLLAGATTEAVCRGLEIAGKETPRMRRYFIGDRLFVQDCYNASPEATVGALEVMTHLAQRRPLVAVLGDMLELGDHAAPLHFAVGEAVARLGFSRLLAYGDCAEHLAGGALQAGMSEEGIRTFAVGQEAGLIHTACKEIPVNAAVLFKASGRMGMKEICEEIGRRI